MCIHLHQNADKKCNLNVGKTKITWSRMVYSLRLGSCDFLQHPSVILVAKIYMYLCLNTAALFLSRAIFFFTKKPRSTDFSFFVPRLHDCLCRFCACVIVKGEANNIYALGQQIIMFFIHNNWIFTLQNLFFCETSYFQ